MPERMRERNQQELISLLKMAYSAELAAAYAYRGHWHSVSDPDEKARIKNGRLGIGGRENGPR